MKNLKFVFPVCLVLILANFAYSQAKFYGNVVEVIDGRTLIIQPQPKVNITLELQYIEVPETEQPLSDVVKEHLKNMVLNKSVEFKPKILGKEKTVGQVFLKGVDISQQMIRDGAAWFAITEKNIQDEDVSKIYQTNEALARGEKRGVWSIADLKPAWEFRAEKEEKLRQEELEKYRKEKEEREEKMRLEQAARAQKQKKVEPEFTTKLGIESFYESKEKSGPIKKGAFGLLYFHDKVKKEGWIATPFMYFEVFDSDEQAEKIYFASGYDYKGEVMIKGGDVFGIAVGTLDNSYPILQNTEISIYLDGNKKVIIDKPQFKSSLINGRVSEVYYFEMSRETLTRIAKSENVTLIVGEHKRKLIKPVRKFLLSILSATAK